MSVPQMLHAAAAVTIPANPAWKCHELLVRSSPVELPRKAFYRYTSASLRVVFWKVRTREFMARSSGVGIVAGRGIEEEGLLQLAVELYGGRRVRHHEAPNAPLRHVASHPISLL
jgi:hypothetical protein